MTGGPEGAPWLLLVAGEASGDLHGAALCEALAALAPGCRLTGMGGARMAAAGMHVDIDLTARAAVGGREVFGTVPALWRAYRRLSAALAGPRKPDALVLIDFPEFNLRLARVARRQHVPVVYFIPPQIWAWRPTRVHLVRRLTSLVLAVFPFEAALYREAGVTARFVGHPVLDALVSVPTRSEARRALGLTLDDLVIGLLPGSREQEIHRMLPVMRGAAARIAAIHPRARFVLGRAPTIAHAALEAALGAGAPPIELTAGGYGIMRAADLLLVTSGTATLEAALLGTPMVVAYRMSRLSEALFAPLVRVPWISLVNIVLGRTVVPELYREAASAERLAATALGLLDSPRALDAQRGAFRELATTLGEAGVGQRAARLILETAAGR